jgi:hypothetical protein
MLTCATVVESADDVQGSGFEAEFALIAGTELGLTLLENETV